MSIFLLARLFWALTIRFSGQVCKRAVVPGQFGDLVNWKSQYQNNSKEPSPRPGVFSLQQIEGLLMHHDLVG